MFAWASSFVARLLNFQVCFLLLLILALSADAASAVDSGSDSLSVVAEPTLAEQPAPKAKDDYAIAYESAQWCGKLCVLVSQPNCEPCEKAKRWFDTAAGESSGACIVLDVERDAKYVQDIADDTAGYPQLVVYTDVGKSPHRECLIGWRAIETRGKAVMIDSKQSSDEKQVAGNASVPAEKLHQVSADTCPPGGCKNCDCKNCDCHASASSASSGSGHYAYVPFQPVRNVGRFFANHQPVRSAGRFIVNHQPVRKAIKGAVVGVVKVGRAVAWRATHPCGGRFRCR
jgi:hypothetical protein